VFSTGCGLCFTTWPVDVAQGAVHLVISVYEGGMETLERPLTLRNKVNKWGLCSYCLHWVSMDRWWYSYNTIHLDCRLKPRIPSPPPRQVLIPPPRIWETLFRSVPVSFSDRGRTIMKARTLKKKLGTGMKERLHNSKCTEAQIIR
jgi:hypothetical protein